MSAILPAWVADLAEATGTPTDTAEEIWLAYQQRQRPLGVDLTDSTPRVERDPALGIVFVDEVGYFTETGDLLASS
jgi:hypothetical protein